MTPEGWLPPAFNGGWSYRDRIEAGASGRRVSAFYASRYRHSGQAEWLRRLGAGEIERNGQRLQADGELEVGDRLVWHRPPWREEAVPARWAVLYDDGDLLVIDKPSGLPVLPAGGWLEHTVLRLLERRHQGDSAGLPRPVHRLGRFTSGLLVCARRPASRAWLSRQLRQSTAGAPGAVAGLDRVGTAGLVAAAARADDSVIEAAGVPEAMPRAGDARGWAAGPQHDSPAVQSIPGCDGPGGGERTGSTADHGCRKLYRALLVPGGLALTVGESRPITTPIGRRDHPQLGQIWCAADGSRPGDLAARSTLTLLERHARADLVQVAIASGRPHQIRIHCAAIGAPLLGDPLYRPGGLAAAAARPGDGGYRLQAWRLELARPGGERLMLEAPAALGVWEAGDAR
ncbi:MAG: RluA family pseudouridine synthase [Cyanobium sp.]